MRNISKKIFLLLCCAALAAMAVLGVIPAKGAEVMAQGSDGNIITHTSVIADITDQAVLAALETTKPASAIIRADSSLNAVDEDGAALGELDTVVSAVVQCGALPILFIDVNSASAVSTYLESCEVKDIAVTATDADLLSPLNVIKHYTYERDVADRTAAREAIEGANSCGAQAIIVRGNISGDQITYIQSLFKSVWVAVETEQEIYGGICGGAYGVVCSDVAAVNAAFNKISASTSGDIVLRSPYIVAHRGLTVGFTENTLGAVRAAAEAGATHVEIDVRLTSDKKIVIMHDENISVVLRNDGGTAAVGNVSQMTLAQLKKYTMSDGISKVAELSEMFELASEQPVNKLIFILEIKTQNPEIVALLKDEIERYNMTDTVCFISLYGEQLTAARNQIPKIPASLLLTTRDGETAVSDALDCGSGIDMQYNANGGLAAFYEGDNFGERYMNLFEYFGNRGYSIWLWTYNYDSMAEALSYGVTGITTDEPMMFTSDSPMKLCCGTVITRTKSDGIPTDGQTIEVPAVAYDGTDLTVTATVYYLDGENAFLVYKSGLFSKTVYAAVTFEIKASGGCSSSAVGGGYFAVILTAMALARCLCGKKQTFLPKHKKDF